MRKVLTTLGILGLLMASAVYFAQGQAPPPASVVATYNSGPLTANLASTLVSPQINPVIYALGGTYKANCYVVETVKDAASSTLPKCQVTFTDADVTTPTLTNDLTATSTANAAQTIGPAPAVTAQLPNGSFHVSPSTAISIDTTGYVSGTPATMTYVVHFTLQYVGP